MKCWPKKKKRRKKMIFNLHKLKCIKHFLDTFGGFKYVASFEVHDNIKKYDFQSYKSGT